jgi:hypothetical protein
MTKPKDLTGARTDTPSGSSYLGTRVRSPNNTPPQPHHAHPDLSTERGDPRRPYTDDGAKLPESRQDKGFVNTMMGGAGGMDSQRPPRSEHDSTRQFARDAVERHLHEHRHGWKR